MWDPLYIIFPSIARYINWSPSFRFPHQNSSYISILHHVCGSSRRSSHNSLFTVAYNVWSGAQNRKFQRNNDLILIVFRILVKNSLLTTSCFFVHSSLFLSCLFACISSAPVRQNVVKFGIEYSFKSVKVLHLIYSVKKSQIWIHSGKNV